VSLVGGILTVGSCPNSGRRLRDEAVRPEWDLDRTGTGEDSGTAYVNVRAPGGDACERYAIVGGY
jgi:hypothetical protein